MYRLIAFFALVLIPSTLSHSWLACTDYTEKNGAYWDPNKCRGFPRDAQRYADKNSFGQDRGNKNFVLYLFVNYLTKWSEYTTYIFRHLFKN